MVKKIVILVTLLINAYSFCSTQPDIAGFCTTKIQALEQEIQRKRSAPTVRAITGYNVMSFEIQELENQVKHLKEVCNLCMELQEVQQEIIAKKEFAKTARFKTQQGYNDLQQEIKNLEKREIELQDICFKALQSK